MHWPPRSPDLTPCDFFLSGFIKNNVFVPPVPVNLQELHDCITAAVALIDRDMLAYVWNELDLVVRCLPYQLRWTHLAFVTYWVKKT